MTYNGRGKKTANKFKVREKNMSEDTKINEVQSNDTANKAGHFDGVVRSDYRIFREKQEEYWDIWCEDAIVFQKDKAIEQVFTEENLRKLIKTYSSPEEYPTYIIEFHENWVGVRIYAKDENAHNCVEDIYYEFVEMASVIVVD